MNQENLSKKQINHEIEGDIIILVCDNDTIEYNKLEAIKKAEETGEDLIQVGEKGGIPVCRIMDYQKLLYIQKKKNKRQKANPTKEIKINYCIAENDLFVKLKKTDKLLQDGHTVKLEIVYRGREIQFIDNARGKLQKYMERLTVPYATNGKEVEISGNHASIVLQPVGKKQT